MDKPRKKYEGSIGCDNDRHIGYNEGIKDYEKWLESLPRYCDRYQEAVILSRDIKENL